MILYYSIHYKNKGICITIDLKYNIGFRNNNKRYGADSYLKIICFLIIKSLNSSASIK